MLNPSILLPSSNIACELVRVLQGNKTNTWYLFTYPSTDLNNKIIETNNELGYKLHVGDVTTMDVFGPYIDYDRVLDRMPKDLNVLGEEMECFGLFHVASHFKKEAACILTAVDSKFSDVVLTGEQRETSLNEMITLALESIIK